jgi:hypothetical protein
MVAVAVVGVGVAMGGMQAKMANDKANADASNSIIENQVAQGMAQANSIRKNLGIVEGMFDTNRYTAIKLFNVDRKNARNQALALAKSEKRGVSGKSLLESYMNMQMQEMFEEGNVISEGEDNLMALGREAQGISLQNQDKTNQYQSQINKSAANMSDGSAAIAMGAIKGGMSNLGAAMGARKAYLDA